MHLHFLADLVLLMVLLYFVESQPSPQWWPKNTTAAGLYNSQTEKCCLGSVFPIRKAKYQKCCGAGVFDSSKQRCCNKVVVPLVPGEECCGDKTINTDVSTCCDNQEAIIAPDAVTFAQCCGKEAYDSRSQSCCNVEGNYRVVDGTSMSCCGNETYNDREKVCCTKYSDNSTLYTLLSKDVVKTACYGDQLYDPKTQFCCGDEVTDLSGCCNGKQPFNETRSTCCDGNVISKNGKKPGCCGSKPFDVDNEVCCYDYSPRGNVTPTVVTKTHTAQTDCCGTEPFDEEKQLCCYETKKVVTRMSILDYECCGDRSYNYGTGLCCNGVLYSNVSGKTHDCCGGKPIDNSKFMCCGGKALDVFKNEYCCGDSKIYDSETKLCCSVYNYNANGSSEEFEVVENIGKKLMCCGKQGFDPSKELCCEQKILPKIGKSQCCGDQSYDTEKEVCCSGTTVFPKENGRDTCCLFGTTDRVPDYPPYDDDMYFI